MEWRLSSALCANSLNLTDFLAIFLVGECEILSVFTGIFTLVLFLVATLGLLAAAAGMARFLVDEKLK